MVPILLVGIFGGLGSITRYLAGSFLLHHFPGIKFPLGTLFVNLTGCLAIGIVAGISQRMTSGNEQLRLALIVGFLGGYTTFSAFGLDTLALIKDGEPAIAILYSFGSILLGVLLVQIGLKCLS